MPRQSSRQNFVTFVGGLNTEASPLTFPENTAKSLDNVELNRNGSIQRRRGLDFEVDGEYSNLSFSISQKIAGISVHEWKSVNGNDALNFAVVRIASALLFYDIGQEPVSPSFLGWQSFADFAIKINPDFTAPLDMTFGKGRLFGVSKEYEPFYVEYDEDTGMFSLHELVLQIRDMDGINEDEATGVIIVDHTPPIVGLPF